MEYVLLLLTLIATVLGVRGNTWDDKKPSLLRRIRPVGWIVIVVALSSTGLLGFKSWRDDQKSKQVILAASKSVRKSLTELYRPFALLYYIQFKKSFDTIQQANSGLDNDQLIEKLVIDLPRDALTEKSFVDFLGTFDAGAPSGDVTSGRRVTFIESIASDLSRGRSRMQTMNSLAPLLDKGMVTRIEMLASDDYLEATINRVPVALALLKEQPGTVIHVLPKSNIGAPDEPVITQYRVFVHNLDDAWRDLSTQTR